MCIRDSAGRGAHGVQGAHLFSASIKLELCGFGLLAGAPRLGDLLGPGAEGPVAARDDLGACGNKARGLGDAGQLVGGERVGPQPQDALLVGEDEVHVQAVIALGDARLLEDDALGAVHGHRGGAGRERHGQRLAGI